MKRETQNTLYAMHGIYRYGSPHWHVKANYSSIIIRYLYITSYQYHLRPTDNAAQTSLANTHQKLYLQSDYQDGGPTCIVQSQWLW